MYSSTISSNFQGIPLFSHPLFHIFLFAHLSDLHIDSNARRFSKYASYKATLQISDYYQSRLVNILCRASESLKALRCIIFHNVHKYYAHRKCSLTNFLNMYILFQSFWQPPSCPHFSYSYKTLKAFQN